MPGSEEIIVPGHPRWPEFLSELGRARICFGTTEQARLTLASMSGVDVDGSLRALARLGGTCDCQIELDLAPLTAGVGA